MALMADASKLRAFKALGSPPSLDEARADLNPAPEPPKSPPPPARRIDARTLRRSGRTAHFATKVTPEWDARIRSHSARTKKMLCEILEEALDAWERKNR